MGPLCPFSVYRLVQPPQDHDKVGEFERIEDTVHFNLFSKVSLKGLGCCYRAMYRSICYHRHNDSTKPENKGIAGRDQCYPDLNQYFIIFGAFQLLFSQVGTESPSPSNPHPKKGLPRGQDPPPLHPHSLFHLLFLPFCARIANDSQPMLAGLCA